MNKKDMPLTNVASPPMSRTMNLKKQLRLYLDHFDMTAAQLARKAGIPKQSLSGWLSGSNPRDVKQVKKIADCLGTTVDNLLFGTGMDDSGMPSRTLDAIVGDEWLGGIFEVRFRRVKK